MSQYVHIGNTGAGHYVRKWEEKDLNDLKALVRLTMRWVNDEIQTNQLLKDMPAGK